jgi:pseudaminic acid biosynthesis-associated methylase
MSYRTDQEQFWAGSFGKGYMERNQAPQLIAANEVLFQSILKAAPGVKSIAELGCNIGLNLIALNRLNPDLVLSGFEINSEAAEKAGSLGIAKIACTTILEPLAGEEAHDLTFTKGVLIHIQPAALSAAYDNLYRLSRRYIMVCEYYNPSPVGIDYRGHKDRLFKRDFAGELIERFGLRLIDYGFVYHRDPVAPQDDLTWFLMEKPGA